MWWTRGFTPQTPCSHPVAPGGPQLPAPLEILPAAEGPRPGWYPHPGREAAGYEGPLNGSPGAKPQGHLLLPFAPATAFSPKDARG